MAASDPVPTLYEWAGGMSALERLTAAFYERVRRDELLESLFANMPDDHPRHVAIWLAEVFEGPAYTDEHGGYRMVSKHLGLAISERQRSRWVQLIGLAADDVDLPADPEFRAAFMAYVEVARESRWRTPSRVRPPPEAPVPRWGWGESPAVRAWALRRLGAPGRRDSLTRAGRLAHSAPAGTRLPRRLSAKDAGSAPTIGAHGTVVAFAAYMVVNATRVVRAPSSVVLSAPFRPSHVRTCVRALGEPDGRSRAQGGLARLQGTGGHSDLRRAGGAGPTSTRSGPSRRSTACPRHRGCRFAGR
jgi:hemoglobin